MIGVCLAKCCDGCTVCESDFSSGDELGCGGEVVSGFYGTLSGTLAGYGIIRYPKFSNAPIIQVEVADMQLGDVVWLRIGSNAIKYEAVRELGVNYIAIEVNGLYYTAGNGTGLWGTGIKTRLHAGIYVAYTVGRVDAGTFPPGALEDVWPLPSPQLGVGASKDVGAVSLDSLSLTVYPYYNLSNLLDPLDYDGVVEIEAESTIQFSKFTFAFSSSDEEGKITFDGFSSPVKMPYCHVPIIGCPYGQRNMFMATREIQVSTGTWTPDTVVGGAVTTDIDGQLHIATVPLFPGEGVAQRIQINATGNFDVSLDVTVNGHGYSYNVVKTDTELICSLGSHTRRFQVFDSFTNMEIGFCISEDAIAFGPIFFGPSVFSWPTTVSAPPDGIGEVDPIMLLTLHSNDGTFKVYPKTPSPVKTVSHLPVCKTCYRELVCEEYPDTLSAELDTGDTFDLEPTSNGYRYEGEDYCNPGYDVTVSCYVTPTIDPITSEAKVKFSFNMEIVNTNNIFLPIGNYVGEVTLSCPISYPVTIPVTWYVQPFSGIVEPSCTAGTTSVDISP